MIERIKMWFIHVSEASNIFIQYWSFDKTEVNFGSYMFQKHPVFIHVLSVIRILSIIWFIHFSEASKLYTQLLGHLVCVTLD